MYLKAAIQINKSIFLLVLTGKLFLFDVDYMVLSPPQIQKNLSLHWFSFSAQENHFLSLSLDLCDV